MSRRRSFLSEPRDPDEPELDPVEEADEESFPASDPPSWATPRPEVEQK